MLIHYNIYLMHANVALENIVVLEESLVASYRMHLCYLIVSDFHKSEPYQCNKTFSYLNVDCEKW